MIEFHKKRIELFFNNQLECAKIDYPNVMEELIMDLCVYLREYGSSNEIKEMEKKYCFDYEKVISDVDRLYCEKLEKYGVDFDD